MTSEPARPALSRACPARPPRTHCRAYLIVALTSRARSWCWCFHSSYHTTGSWHDERGDNWKGSDAYGNDPDFSGGKYRRGGEYAKDIVGF